MACPGVTPPNKSDRYGEFLNTGRHNTMATPVLNDVYTFKERLHCCVHAEVSLEDKFAAPSRLTQPGDIFAKT